MSGKPTARGGAAGPPTGEAAVDRRAVVDAAATAGYAQLWAAAASRIARRQSAVPPGQRASEAEEVVQEAIRRALDKADEYDPSRSPIAWITGFIANVSSEASRSTDRQVRLRGAELADVEHLLTDAVDESVVQRYGPLLDAALAHLTDPERRLLTLIRDESLDGRKLAQRLGLPSDGAARVARHRAIRAAQSVCRQMLAEQGEEVIP